ncbi:MAG: recombinase family protein [Ruminococcus sp.]|uniref:recombinase family protein n=1 Tax=Ruminococcus sp. TaxID=41978 RepID=UPI0025EE922C|nr:recombinase family protein [Ruminococcus sp.]MCR5540675.1 recombinase family protein [Ruminococcus sp.]
MATVTIIKPTIDTSMIRKIRCAAYCRVSSSSDDQLHSYSTQVKYYSEMFNDSDTEELVDIYADKGITGTSEEKRDEFKRLINDCKRGKIDRIYTKSISRFARNTKDCLNNLRQLKSLGISVFFEKESIDTSDVSDEIMITLLGGLAQEESTSISQNMRWSIRKRMANGTFEQGVAPYGYTKVDGKIVIDQETSKIVKDIFKWYLEGIGATSIARILNDKGILTGMNEIAWTHRMVIYVLTNEKYAGDTLIQKTFTTEVLPVKRHINRGERDKYYISNTHEPIISRVDFDKVQEILSEQKEKYYVAAKEKHPLGSMIKCSYCNKTYRRKNSNGKYYWSCITHDSQADLCPAHMILEKRIYDAFIKLCNKLIIHSGDILIPLRHELKELYSTKYSSNSVVMDLRRDISEINEQKHVISRLRTKGFLDEKKYNEQLLVLENKHSKIKHELAKLSNSEREDDTLEQLDTLIDCFENRSIMTEFDKEIFGIIVEKIIVKGNDLEFYLISGLRFSETI